MRMKPSVNEQVLTGEIPQPVTSSIMQQRVNAIKYRTSSKIVNFRKSEALIQPTTVKQNRTILQPQSDTLSTNFWPLRPTTNSVQKRPTIENRRSQDYQISRPKSNSVQVRKFRGTKSVGQTRIGKSGDAVTYARQLKIFENLYENLAQVLEGIKNGLDQIERAISCYGKFIQGNSLQFIDDFMENADVKIRKIIRMSRIHEYLSIAYLFLQIGQQRMENNQSYLINFIGFCLSNLIFIVRVYILLERRTQYEEHNFQKQVEEFQIKAYGESLHNLDDVLLRMQHNNEIVTMIHKKLGRLNQKFQECIKNFLKTSERKKYTTCLCAHYIFQYLSMHIHQSELLGISQFLQVAPTPYLAPQNHQYTLVFQPIGIIQNGKKLRPYFMQFIKWAAKHFDLVMWSWEMPAELQDIVSLLDPYLFAKLYRYHCIIKDQIFTKDLNRLGRNLEKTLLIDYDERIFSTTPKNGLVCRWKGKGKQKGLLVLSEIMEEMISSESSVEQMLTFYAEELHVIRGI